MTTGSLPAPSCPPSGNVYIVNLQTRTAAQSAACGTGISADASGDGKYVVIGGVMIGGTPCVYSAQSASFTTTSVTNSGDGYGIGISSDGNVIGSNQILSDISLNVLGSVAHPIPFYGNSTNSLNPPQPLLRPRLNASGSLYYFAYPNYIEIIDVAHASLRMRFSLTETIQSTAAPLAIDSGGRHVYLSTDKGLTVIDLGAAPLSIGHLTPQTPSPGALITVRGSGFDSTITASVGGVAATVNVTDENTLTLAIPAASAGPDDIVLTRGDGATYTLENAVVLP